MSEVTSDGAKKLLAASGLGLGIAGSGLAADTDERSADRTLQEVPRQVLVFGYEYNPGLAFEAVNRVQQGTVNSVLGQQVGEDGRPIVNDTADYNGYVIRYQPEQDAGEYALVFVRDGALDIGGRFSFGTGVTFFASEANLITVSIDVAESAGTPTEETTTVEGTTTETDAQTTADGNQTTPTTTEAVIVDDDSS